jgi:hypothetical protein
MLVLAMLLPEGCGVAKQGPLIYTGLGIKHIEDWS